MKRKSEEITGGAQPSARAMRARNRQMSILLVEELVVCPISLERMRDPVQLVQSGITYDRKHLCQSLLRYPSKDPKSNVEYNVPLEYSPNYTVRAFLTQGHGDEAFEKFDDSSFKAAYGGAWERFMIERLENNTKLSFETVRLLAERGHSEARFKVGLAYDESHSDVPGVGKDFEAAKQWYRKASEQGHAKAQCNLGCLYGFGKEGVEEPNHKFAVKWFRKAAEQGLRTAQFNLGMAYSNGNGVKQSNDIAVEWWHKAAKQGLACAQLILGNAYHKGRGVKQSNDIAVEWWSEAADQGEACAQFNLGVAYSDGIGVKQSHKMAVEWWHKAADQGDADAQFCLGLAYSNGKGVKRCHEVAMEWWHKAADQGNADAQRNLDNSYDENGEVGKESQDATVYFWQKVAEQGFFWARRKLAEAYAKMSGKVCQEAANQGEVNEAE